MSAHARRPVSPSLPLHPSSARARHRRAAAALAALSLAATGLVALAAPPALGADRTVALVGSLQDELGCPGDWQPDCAVTELAPTTTPGVYEAEFAIPAGSWEYKVAIDDAWDESYGHDGENVPLTLAGEATIRVTYDDASHRIALTPLGLAGDYTAADDALVAAPVRQAGDGENFYFVMTDRFANGDASNDTGGITGDRLDHGFDPTDKGFYHGGDLAGLRARLDYVEGLGTTAIWLTPSFLNRPVQGTGADASAGYHGYWITDFTQIDPHLGTNAELEALIEDAHARGIKVYFDIITNHTADVIDYAEGAYDYVDRATSPYRDTEGTAFDPADYAGTDDFPALDSATSFPYTPVIDPADAAVKVPAWLNDPTLYHNRGNSTWSGESVTYGDFSGLDDLMTEHPTVVEGFVEVYQDWIDLGIDGFRVDTAKHVNFEFWERWTTEVLDYAHAHGKPDFFMFGEVYDADAAKTAPYVRGTDMSSVLDFSFQSAAATFARGFTPDSLANLFASDDWYTTPTSSATALPTFLGNHDMGRIGYFVKDSGSALERSALAHSLMYLTRGQPVVYYGDEQGFVGDGSLGGTDKDARQSLFATQVTEYAEQDLLTGERAGSQDRFDTDAPLYEHVAGLAALRASTPALVDGAQLERPVAGPGAGSVYAFSRVLPTDKLEHLVALNNAETAAQVQVTSLTPGATFTSLYGGHAAVTADDGGQVTLTVPPLGAVVLVADSPVAAVVGGPSLELSAPAPGAELGASTPVTASVADAWSQTSFAYRVVGDADWTPLGTAEDTTPRVFHDTVGLARGTLVEYRAVTTDAAGARAAASTFASVGVPVDGVEPVDPGPGEGEAFVTVPGSFNAAAGCPGDWQPDCAAIALTHRGNDVYAGTFDLPAGAWEYKVAVGGSWDENYGAGGVPGGANVTFTLDAPTAVTFVYSHRLHRFTSSAQGELVTLPGSFQSEVGCPGDWAPDCLGTWLAPLGDGTYSFTTDLVPAGAWEVKVAHGLSWGTNYGAGGVQDGPNIAFSAPGGKPVTFVYDGATHLLTIEVTDPPLAGLGEQRAHWVDASTIAWPAELAPSTDGLTWSLHHEPAGVLDVAEGAVVGGTATPLALDPGGLTPAQAERFPHLAGYLALRLPDGVTRADVESWLTGELLVSQHAADGTASAIMGVQVPGVLDDVFAADARRRDLGVTWRKGVPTLALWAPTATDVDLLLWRDGRGKGEPRHVAMRRAADGTWTVTGAKSWRGKAYRFEVDVYAPSVDALVTNDVTDPYSVALTTDSTHSVLVDLADKAYRPRAWEKAKQPVVRPVDQTIYELHVRDFSISDRTVPARLRGTYGAFAHPKGDGAKHLRTLAKAGLTTVHLLPTFDIASIPEDRRAQAEPDCDLESFAPDSPAQQECIEPVRDLDGFNWGYDPWHFTTPEGSYAVHADGGARVAEFRTMVGALHSMGLQVVLDQVFNHTAAAGQDERSVLDRVVPGYYHRLSATGTVETSTCCQNLATEHTMMGKLMVDSVVTWARDYKVDGFRFDLMGHHSTANMADVRAALDRLTVRKDGVDGSKVYLYGEGWNFGEVADDARFEQATQGQLGGTGIGTFSDRLRDAVRGGGPFDEDPRIQGFGSGAYTDPNGAPANGSAADQLGRVQHAADLVRLGLAGNLRDFAFRAADGQVRTGAEIDYNGQPAGYADSPEEVITYVDAHDNETLFDSLTLKLPTDTSMVDRVRMNTLSLATTALAQTPSFWHAGAELLRSKSLDRNSYNSGDWFNVLDFSKRTNGFGRGLPPAGDNEAKWAFQQPLLADRSLAPSSSDIRKATANAQDLLRLRFSTDLFRLGSAELIEQKVSFPGSGPDAQPGVVVMHVDDTVGRDVDRALDGVLVVLNASPEAVTVPVAGLAGERYELASVQAKGADPVVKRSRWDVSAGAATVPARTVAVFVDAQRAGHGGHHPKPPRGGCRFRV